MPDINCHGEMTTYHRQNVTLSSAQQGDMRKRRDAGRTRLKNGLDTAGKPQPKEVRSQGSYQMRTMVQDDANDYDIDDGAYFQSKDLVDEDGLALTPLASRKRVCDALKWDGRFKKEAAVKRNCVRQEYAEGYHIDVPVYRIQTAVNIWGEAEERYELASGDDWIASDARSVTRWFNNLVGELNAGEADGSQMRRVTKLSKKFARRTNWKSKTTSGITITRLVVDHFEGSAGRDDLALRKTWRKIRDKLLWSTEIKHPVVASNLANEGDAQVVFFRDCLGEALTTLEILDRPDCTRKQAREAWDDVFDIDFFSNQPDDDDEGRSKVGEASMAVTSFETARRSDGGGRFG
jgi:hypothetical protein